MHASPRRLCNCLLLLAVSLGAESVSATPHVRRAAITASALNPWVSIDTSGKASTVTPALTTINGVATTLNAAPAAITGTATTTDGSATPTTAGGPEATQEPIIGFEVCHNMDGDFKPFCLPENGTSVYTGEKYFVTWDSSYFKPNETLNILATFVNATGGGPQAFDSGFRAASWGFVSWKIDPEWLKGLSSNNVTLHIASQDKGRDPINGPTVMVMNRPPEPAYSQPPTKAPKGKELYIGLPVIFGFIVLCVCGGYMFNRRKRQIGLGNIMGRKKGYGVGKSRRQRLGLGRKGGAIQLRTQELTAEGQYRDEPTQQHANHPGHRSDDSDGLASLVGTPTDERPQGGNVFREELRRQDQTRY